MLTSRPNQIWKHLGIVQRALDLGFKVSVGFPRSLKQQQVLSHCEDEVLYLKTAQVVWDHEFRNQSEMIWGST